MKPCRMCGVCATHWVKIKDADGTQAMVDLCALCLPRFVDGARRLSEEQGRDLAVTFDDSMPKGN